MDHFDVEKQILSHNSEGAMDQLDTEYQVLSHNSHGSSPTINASNTQSPNSPNKGNDKALILTASATIFNDKDPSSCFEKFFNIIGVILFALLSPFIVLYVVLSVCLTGEIDTGPSKLFKCQSGKTSNDGSDKDHEDPLISCSERLPAIIVLIMLTLFSPLILPYAILSICLTGDVLEPDDLKKHQSPNNGDLLKDGACLNRCVCAYGSILLYTLCFTTLVVVFPFVLAQSILVLSLTGKCVYFNVPLKPKSPKTKGLYQKIFEFKPIKVKLKHLNTVITVRLGCLSLLWLVVNLCVPSLRRKTLFGSLLWKWSLLAVVILLGHFSSIFTISFPLEVLSFFDILEGKNRLLYFIRGLQSSVTTLLYFAMILCVWKFYFQTDDGLNPNPGGIDMYWRRALVFLLVGATLWVLKSALMLHWKAKAILERFKDRIITAGIHFFFLSIILWDYKEPSLLPWGCEIRNRKKDVTLLQIKEVARPLTRLAEETLRDDSATAEILQKCQEINLSNDEGGPYISEDLVVGLLKQHQEYACLLFKEVQAKKEELPAQKEEKRSEKEEVREEKEEVRPEKEEVRAEKEEVRPEKEEVREETEEVRPEKEEARLEKEEEQAEKEVVLQEKEEVRAEYPSDERITCETFRKWMVDAHKNCLSLGYTLNDAFSMASILDVVLRCFIVAVVILSWLIATGLAATKVLITIGTIFVSLTFMFGDTCKAFFQGVIFSFVTHPFDIGDRCVIDGVEVEVKRIGILTTTCLKIGTEEKRLYPNSNLSTKLIINLEAKPDPTDLIELVMDSSTKSDQIESLRKKIIGFFDAGNAHGDFDKYHEVMVKEMGDHIKMIIQFKHILNVEDVTHSKCFEKKNRQQYEVFIKMKKLLEDLDIKAGTQ